MFMVISTKIVPKKYKKLKFGWFFSQNGWLTGGFGGCVGVLTKKWVIFASKWVVTTYHFHHTDTSWVFKK
ncbi:MAG: hypothetical protein EBZ69_05690 [Alphaproteobacteria bacterium]|nr:hypothetical protein [Alphaproteobacteria bacterium]